MCSNSTVDTDPHCKCSVKVPRILNGTECHGYMDYSNGNHSGDYTNRWSHCSVHDLKTYVKSHSQCGPFCRACRAFCLRRQSDEPGEGTKMEYSDACDILPFVSRSSVACDSCDDSNKTTKPHCHACYRILGVLNGEKYINQAAWQCFKTNPTIIRCDPEGDASHAEITACVEAECSSMILGEERPWRNGEYSSCFLLVCFCLFQ